AQGLRSKLQHPGFRETAHLRHDPWQQAHSECHVERSETSLIIARKLGKMLAFLHFAQDDSFVSGCWSLEFGAAIISSAGEHLHPFAANPRDDRVSLRLAP